MTIVETYTTSSTVETDEVAAINLAVTHPSSLALASLSVIRNAVDSHIGALTAAPRPLSSSHGLTSSNFLPYSDPGSDKNYNPTFGDPNDPFYGVSDNTDEAMHQLLNALSWINAVGISNNIPPSFAYFMLGLEKRMDTTWAGKNDATLDAMKTQLAALANQQVDNTTFGTFLVNQLMGMMLYKSQDASGQSVIDMLRSMRTAFGGQTSNPMLAGFMTAIDYNLNSAGNPTQSFVDWLNKHIDPTHKFVCDGDGNPISYKDWCDANGQNIFKWLAKSDTVDIWHNMLMDWLKALLSKFMNALESGSGYALPIVLNIMGAMLDSSQNKAGSLGFTSKALQTAVTTFSKVVSDASTADISTKNIQELVTSLHTVAVQIDQDPRLASAAGVVSTAKSLSGIKNQPGSVLGDNATIEQDILAYTDVNSPHHGDEKLLADAKAAWDKYAGGTGQLQTISTELQAASSNLTNISQATAPQIQQQNSMTTQMGDVMQQLVTKSAEMNDKIVENYRT